MSINTFYREQYIDRMYEDGTYEECKEDAFEEIMDSKDMKDWINDVIITKIAEDYDMSYAVRKFTDEQKLDFFNELLTHIAESLDDKTDEMAHDSIVVMVEDGE